MKKNTIPWKSPAERYRFEKNNLSFKDVVGDSDEFHDSLGRMVISFSYLEDVLSETIIKLIKTEHAVGVIITSELSFKNKLNLLASLFTFYNKTHRFNSFFENQEETFAELLKACFNSEDFRNQIFHSSFEFGYGEIHRKKTTAKAKKGIKVTREKVDSGYILNIADFIYETGASVEEFFCAVKEKK